MINPAIRPARPEDCTQVKRIAMEAYTPYLARMDREPFPMLDDYAAHIAGGHVFLAEKNDDIAGYIVLLPTDEGLLLDNIGVSPQFQGQRIGTFLVSFAESHARTAGQDTIWLYTNEIMTENLAWYAKLGFRETRRAMEMGYKRVYFAKELNR